jgi:hypothetical protein
LFCFVAFFIGFYLSHDSMWYCVAAEGVGDGGRSMRDRLESEIDWERGRMHCSHV